MSAAKLTAEILQQVSLITEDEGKLQRALRALKRITMPKPDPTEMTYEQFVARVREAEKTPTRTFDSVEELDRYIQSRI